MDGLGSSRAFLTSHNTLAGSPLQPQNNMVWAYSRQCAHVLTTGNSMGKRAKARSIGHRPSSWATAFTTLSTEHLSALERFVLVFIPVHCTGHLGWQSFRDQWADDQEAYGACTSLPRKWALEAGSDLTAWHCNDCIVHREHWPLCSEPKRINFHLQDPEGSLPSQGPGNPRQTIPSGCTLGMNC